MNERRLLVYVPGWDGGVGRSMAQLFDGWSPPGYDVELIANRDKVRPRVQEVFRFARIVLDSARTPRQTAHHHLNLSVGGSTLRKGLLATVLSATGRPYSLHLHSGRYPGWFRSQHPFIRSWIRRVFRRATFVVVLGESWYDFTLELGVDPGRIRLIPNGSPERVSAANKSDRLIAVVGDVSLEKGSAVLAEALRSLGDRHLIVELVGPVLNDGGLAADHRVRLRGPVPGDEVGDLLDRAGVYVSASRSEAMSMALLEAMAAGCGIVATDVGSHREVLEGVGRVVPPDAPEALAAAIAELLADPPLARSRGGRARERHAERYSIGAQRTALIKALPQP